MRFLEGGGAAGDAIRSHDWSGSAIGPPEDWPASLKTTVGLVLPSRFPQCIIWGPSLVTIPNDAFMPIVGDKPAVLGRPFSEVWSEVWLSLEPIVAKAFAGEATYIEDWPLTIDRHGYPERANFTFCYSPIRDEHGRVLGMLDTVTETTAKVALHERQKLLAGELGHRLKNLLAVVQSVAGQTLRRASDLKDADRLLADRLAAIGRASDVLTASEWSDADLHDLVQTALASHGHVASRVRMHGPPVGFAAPVALSLTLAVHELITNAIKYGALSNDAGHVDLCWSIDGGTDGDGQRLKLVWREVDGDVSISYDPAGLVFRIDAPLAGTQS